MKTVSTAPQGAVPAARAFASLSLFLCFAFAGLADAVWSQVPFGLPVVVSNPTEDARAGERVAVSVVVPEFLSSLDPSSDFHVVRSDGTPVPAQMKVLSRWHAPRDDASAAVAWVQTKFRADFSPSQTRTFYLVPGPGPTGSLTSSETFASITVNTGSAIFEIPKSGSGLLTQVAVSGIPLLPEPLRLEFIGLSEAPAGITLRGAEIEESGGIETVVRQRGSISGADLAFTIRYRFVAGQSGVDLDFRLENPRAYGLLPGTGNADGTAHFHSLSIVLKGAAAAHEVVESGTSYSVGNPAHWRLRQRFIPPSNPLAWTDGFLLARETANGTVENQERHQGAIALRRGPVSFAVAVDRFWENAPKEFRLDDDELRIALWPASGHGPGYGGLWGTPSTPNLDGLSDLSYRFEGSRRKSHRLRLDFRVGNPHDASEVDALARSLATPLYAHAPLAWNFQHRGFAEAVVEARAWPDESSMRYERFLGLFGHDDSADSFGIYPQIGLPEFRRRGGTFGGRQMYGWENFGDLAWDEGFSSLHYDIPATTIMGWFRTGDRRFLDVGEDLVAHRRDYDQMHTQDPSADRRGGPFYEKGFYHGNFQPPALTHTWVEGTLLHYLATGDEASYAAACELGEFVLRRQPENWNGWWGARIPGWGLEALVHLWFHLGDARYLASAAGVVEAWNAAEAADGMMGHVVNPGHFQQPHAQSWMHGIMLGALGKYHFVTGAPHALVTMDRMADWFSVEVVETMPAGPMSNRSVARVWERVGPNGFRADPSRHHVWSILHGLSYAAICLDDPAHLATAESLFESATRYWQFSAGFEGTMNYLDSGSFDPITFKPVQFSGTETKALGNIGLWGEALLAARAIFEGNF
jgi:hypothetical protein